MNIELPTLVDNIISKLQEHGHEAYAVGGCVRDSILGRNPNDWDITTDALPCDVKKMFSRTFDTGIEHGTVTVVINHNNFEVTTYRIDGEYFDSRHPSEVTFTRNLEEDLKRRDFTINALAYNKKEGIVDKFNGIEDLEAGIIRAVGDPKKRFEEDALRMLRAVRFAAQLDFEIEENTYNAIKELAPTIKNISVERIREELLKLIESNNPRMIITLYELGLTKFFMPEFDRIMKTDQQNIHHVYSVGEHTVVAMEKVESTRVLRLAMLCHDLGKPDCITFDDDGTTHFKGHQEKSAIITKEILKRLKFDNETIKKVVRLVEFHDERPGYNEKKIRKSIVKIGLEAFPELFAVKRADTLAQSNYMREEKLESINVFESVYYEILEKKDCVTKKDLMISGRDLIDIGIKQGPEIGEVIDILFKEVVDEPTKNDKEYLINRAKELLNDKR